MVHAFLKELSVLKRMNWLMPLVVVLLLTVGVVFVYSSCIVSEVIAVRQLWKRQIVWAIVGLLSYTGFSAFNYRHLRKYAWWLYALCGLLLILVLIPHVGRVFFGARRWIRIFGIMVQPSELAKLALIILLAGIMSRPGLDYGSLGPVLLILALVGIPTFLIMVEPDLGTAMILVMTSFIMMFAAGVRLKYLGAIVAVGLLLVGLLLGILLLPEKMGMDETEQEVFLDSIGMHQHWKMRLLVYFGMVDDPLGVEYNKIQSVITVGSGGVWGKGFGKGTQKELGFLPYSVAPTDFIYAVIAEEKGFVGSVVVLFLFGVVLILGMSTAVAASDKLGRLLCAGVVGMIFCHVFVNIAMTVGFMPITGLPLPLLSYGGSSIVVMMSALGIIQSVHIRSRRISSVVGL